MKQKKLSTFIALSICLEMMLSPLAVHAQTGGANSNNNNNNNRGGDKFNNTLNTVNNVLNTGMNAYNRLNGQAGGGNDGVFQGQMAAIQDSSRPNVDNIYNLNTLMRIPGFAEYLKTPPQNSDPKMNPANTVLNCFTMPPKFHETRSEICEVGISPSLNMTPQAQAMEAKSYFNQYLQLQNNYEEFGVTPWSDDMFSAARGNTSMLSENQKGYGCMKNMGQVLDAFFAYRMNELNKMKTQLAAWTADIKKNTQADTDQIMRNSAILKGPTHPASKAPFNKTKAGDFDYAKRFADPACTSMMANNSVNELGKAGGLLGIQKDVVDKYSNPVENGPYSPKDYLKFSSNVERDIKDMAKSMARQARSGFGKVAASGSDYGRFIQDIAGEIKTDSGVHEGISKGIFTNIQNSFNEQRNVLSGQLSVIEKEFGAIGVGTEAKEELLKTDNDDVFETEVSALEDQIKGQCAARAPIDQALARIHDPKLSKEANKATTLDIKRKISAIMKNVRLSESAKRKQIKALNLDRFQVKLDSEVTYNQMNGEKVSSGKIGPSEKLTPDMYFDTVMKNCEAEYSVQNLNKRMPAKKAIAELRRLKREYKQLAVDNSKKIEKEIVDKMLNCGTDKVQMNSQAEGQCSPARFSLRSPTSNFCAASAKSCATNMKSCNESATKMVDELKNERTKLATKYNAFMEDKKKTVVSMFKMNLEKFTREGEMLRSQFKNKSGFDTPQGIKWEVDENKRFMKGLEEGDEVSLEDPDAIVAMFEENIDNLAKQVKQQQDEILGSDTAPTLKVADERLKIYKENVRKAKGMADQCNNVYKKWIADTDMANKMADEQFAKAQKELGEKKAALCSKYSDIMDSDPKAMCDDKIGQLTTDVVNAAGSAGTPADGIEAKRIGLELKRYCLPHMKGRDKDGKSTVTAGYVCDQAQLAKPNEVAVNVIKDLIKYAPKVDGKDMGIGQFCDQVINDQLATCPDKYETMTVSGSVTKEKVGKDCAKKLQDIVDKYNSRKDIGEVVASTDPESHWEAGNESDGGYNSTHFCNASYSAQGTNKGNPTNKSGVQYGDTANVKKY